LQSKVTDYSQVLTAERATELNTPAQLNAFRDRLLLRAGLNATQPTTEHG
jgi:hypothetical protein